ncbi:HNH endonuclease [Kitasatospora sp. NPDC058170]|uniref:HNH endonuclease n=1 Tax=Kitasatospora sp. NPDC058170 TaxID=3346364 RepID=UPI0036DC9301
MSEQRPAVPRPLARRLLVEAGHRCAIPTCRADLVELAHIRPWAEVRCHEFDNMIVLCPNCHTRFDRGDIDRMAMREYKRLLGRPSGRAANAHWAARLTSAYLGFQSEVTAWRKEIASFRATVMYGAGGMPSPNSCEGGADRAAKALSRLCAVELEVEGGEFLASAVKFGSEDIYEWYSAWMADSLGLEPSAYGEVSEGRTAALRDAEAFLHEYVCEALSLDHGDLQFWWSAGELERRRRLF